MGAGNSAGIPSIDAPERVERHSGRTRDEPEARCPQGGTSDMAFGRERCSQQHSVGLADFRAENRARRMGSNSDEPGGM